MFGNSCAVDYEIRVPAGTRVHVDASSGDVHAEDLRSTQPVVLAASSGDIDAVGVTAPALKLYTSSGDIEASRVRADTVRAEASSGDVLLALARAADRVDAVASSGDIHVDVPDALYRVDDAGRAPATWTTGSSGRRRTPRGASPRRPAPATSTSRRARAIASGARAPAR